MSAPVLEVQQRLAQRGLRQAQALLIFREELRKNFLTRRGFWIYLLAFLPAVVMWLHSLITLRGGTAHSLGQDTDVFAGVFQIFFLRPAVFFGCVGIFTYLFRGEVMERSLHYYFLAPVRREVILLSKYAAGVVTSAFLFGSGILLTFSGIYAHFPGHELQPFLQNGGYGHAIAYTGITCLACAAYGAVFTYAGIRWKNPVLAAIILLIWESINLFLPSYLKKLSVLYYLRSMAPVSVPLTGPAAILGGFTEPVSFSVAIVALCVITALVLLLAAVEVGRMEINYSSD